MKIQVLVLALIALMLTLLLWKAGERGSALAMSVPEESLEPAGESVELADWADPVAAPSQPASQTARVSIEESASMTPSGVEAGVVRVSTYIAGELCTTDGVRVPGATILVVRDGDRGFGGVETDSEGQFRIEVKAGGEVDLRVGFVQPDWWHRRPGALRAKGTVKAQGWVQWEPVHAVAGDHEVLVLVGPSGGIEGSLVFHPEHGDMGLRLALRSESSGDGERPTRVDEDGQFLFDNLDAGVYTVVFGGWGWAGLEVSGVHVRRGHITRDPRLEGLQLENLFFQTKLTVLGQEGGAIEHALIAVYGADGQALIPPSPRSTRSPLPLPRGQEFTIWVSASGHCTSQVTVRDQAEVTLQLKAGIRARLQAAVPRIWDLHEPLDLRRVRSVSQAGAGDMETVRLPKDFEKGAVHELNFPGPGRYELWRRGSAHAQGLKARMLVDPSGSWMVTVPRPQPIKAGASVLVTEADQDGLLVIHLPVVLLEGK